MTAIYPNNIATDAELLTGTNNWQTSLNGALADTGDNTGGNGIALLTIVGLPLSGVVTIGDEVVYYSGITGNNLTGTVRGFDNTMAVAHDSGTLVGVEYVAMHHNALKDEIISIETDLLTGIRANAFSNLLINPGFEIWQRGAIFSNPANNAYTADKWQMNYSGTPLSVVSRNSTAIFTNLGQYSLQCQINTVGGATTFSIRQSIENYQDFIGKTVSFSVWVNSTTPGIKAFITNGTIATSLSAAHAGGSAFQRLTCTYTVPAGSTALIIGIGYVDVAPALSTFYLDSAMFVMGSQAVDYQPSRIADDVNRCQRHYEVSNPFYEGTHAIKRSASQNYISYFSIPFIASKSLIPTITISTYSATMNHTPVTGNGTSPADQANWPLTPTAGLNGFYIGSVRSVDQTTYSLLSVEFYWAAEVT